MSRFYIPIVDGKKQFPSFNRIKNIGKDACHFMFERNADLTSVLFENLTTVGESGCRYMFGVCQNLTTASFPKLTSVSGQYGCNYMFSMCSKLNSVSLPVLETAGEEALSRMFEYCTELKSINFLALTNIASKACDGMFASSKGIEHIYFPALTTDSFKNYTNQFDGLLANTGINAIHTIHFPNDLQALASSFTGYPLFGGNTGYVVLAFDLDSKINFNIVGATGEVKKYVNGKEYFGEKIPHGLCKYIIIDSMGKIVAGNVTTAAGDVVNIDINFSNTNRITITPDVVNTTVKFNISDYEIIPVTSGNSSYIEVHSNTVPLDIYYEAFKSGYKKHSETLAFSNSNITKNITMEISPCIVDLTPGLTSYGWENSTTTNPKATDGWSMYQSTNKGKGNSKAVMKVTIDGYDTFTYYINSYAESNFDYTIASKIDASYYPASYSDTTAFEHTRGFQKDPTVFGTDNYKTVTYTNLGGSEHFFYIVFIKDGSADSNDDRGYILIDETQ